METRCSITGCTNSTTNSQPFQFFSFPLDFDLCMLWVQKCARPELLEEFTYGGAQPFINKLVCSIHFSRSCFVNEDTTNGELKQHAIPTLNLNTDNVVLVKSEVETDESLMYNTSIESEEAKNSYVEDSEGIISFIEVDSIKQEIPSEEEHGFDQHDEESTKTKSDDEGDLPLLLIAREELFFNETDLKYSDSTKSKQAYKKAFQRALENSNQRSSRNQVNALRNAQKRAHESKQERELRLYKNAVRAAFRRKMESEEEQNDRRKKNALRAAHRRSNETEEQREERRLKDRVRSAQRRQHETEAQSQVRKYNDAVRAAFRRRNETEEQKERRRMFDIMRAARKRSNENDEQRKRRLEADRKRAAKRRMLKKICNGVSEYKDIFNPEMAGNDSSELNGSSDDSYMNLIGQLVEKKTSCSESSFDSFKDRSNSNDDVLTSSDNFTNYNLKAQ